MSRLTRNEIVKFIEEKTQIKLNYDLPSLLFKDSLYVYRTRDNLNDINEAITDKIKTKVDENYTFFCGILDSSDTPITSSDFPSIEGLFYKIFLFDNKDNILCIKLDSQAKRCNYIKNLMQNIDNLQDICVNKTIAISDYDTLEKFIEDEMSLDYLSSDKVDIIKKVTQDDIYELKTSGDSVSEAYNESIDCFIDNGEFEDEDEDEDGGGRYLSEEEYPDLKKVNEKYIVLNTVFSGDSYGMLLADKNNNIYRIGWNHDFYACIFQDDDYDKFEIYSSNALKYI